MNLKSMSTSKQTFQDISQYKENYMQLRDLYISMHVFLFLFCFCYIILRDAPVNEMFLNFYFLVFNLHQVFHY